MSSFNIVIIIIIGFAYNNYRERSLEKIHNIIYNKHMKIVILYIPYKNNREYSCEIAISFIITEKKIKENRRIQKIKYS